MPRIDTVNPAEETLQCVGRFYTGLFVFSVLLPPLQGGKILCEKEFFVFPS